MSNNLKNPREYDAVLGNQNIAPVNGAVLGGIDRLKRLSNQVIENPISTLSEAFNYGEEGLAFVIQALNHSERQVHQSAYELLKDRPELEVKAALEKYLQPDNLIHFDGFYKTSDNLNFLRFS